MLPVTRFNYISMRRLDAGRLDEHEFLEHSSLPTLGGAYIFYISVNALDGALILAHGESKTKHYNKLYSANNKRLHFCLILSKGTQLSLNYCSTRNVQVRSNTAIAHSTVIATSHYRKYLPSSKVLNGKL